MHDQVRVRVRDRVEHVEEQPHARARRSSAWLVAVAIDVLAVDELEHQVGLPARRHARIDQVRDVRMREPGEKAAFLLEALVAAAARSARH